MSLVPVPELRVMIATAKQFVANEVHFSFLVGPARECAWWAKVHGLHPAIQQLATDWQLGADLTWNEYWQHAIPITVDEFRSRVAADLGEAAGDSSHAGRNPFEANVPNLPEH